MATIEATAAKLQRSLERIAKVLGVEFKFVHGPTGHRQACYLEQIANHLDPKGEAVAPYVINKEPVMPASRATEPDDPPVLAAVLPPVPAGFQAIGYSGGYVLLKSGEEKYLGPAGEWRDRPRSDDTFEDERSAIEAAIILATPPDPEPLPAKKGKASSGNRQKAPVA